MSVVTKMAVTAVGALATALVLAVPASAEPGDNPCDFAINSICRFIPIAPDLEGSIDLTQQLPPADPNAPPPESLPVVNPCAAAGCI
jgi:hypothetical protein